MCVQVNEFKEKHWEWDRKPDWVLVDKDYNVCVRLFDGLQIRTPGVRLHAIGVGGVYTVPEARGHGHATKFLREFVFPFIAARKPVAVLYSRERNLYKSLGFRVIATVKERHLWAMSLDSNIRVFPGDWSLIPEITF